MIDSRQAGMLYKRIRVLSNIWLLAAVMLAQTTPISAQADKISLEGLTQKAQFADSTFQLPLGLHADNFLIPEDNPMTKNKIELGRALYFDVRLSANNTISCATCHAPNMAFTDNQPVSLGINRQKGRLSSPTVINRAFSEEQFWDGRAVSLEEQAKGPLINPVEMGNPNHDYVINKLKNIDGYVRWFKKVFNNDVNINDLAKAIASFERTVVSGNSRVDRYNMGDETALTDSEKRGLVLFREKGSCNKCHSGSNFSDEMFHNIGVGWEDGEINLGRYSVTKNARDIGAFKTPTLREISKTAPYMHDGRFATLEQVMDFYIQGGEQNPFLDTFMKKLEIKEHEKNDIVAFLKALDGEGWQHLAPPDRFPE
ncbi:MAG: cytochrome-c peroxidase [Nitrospinota bacterium]